MRNPVTQVHMVIGRYNGGDGGAVVVVVYVCVVQHQDQLSVKKDGRAPVMTTMNIRAPATVTTRQYFMLLSFVTDNTSGPDRAVDLVFVFGQLMTFP